MDNWAYSLIPHTDSSHPSPALILYRLRQGARDCDEMRHLDGCIRCQAAGMYLVDQESRAMATLAAFGMSIPNITETRPSFAFQLMDGIMCAGRKGPGGVVDWLN